MWFSKVLHTYSTPKSQLLLLPDTGSLMLLLYSINVHSSQGGRNKKCNKLYQTNMYNYNTMAWRSYRVFWIIDNEFWQGQGLNHYWNLWKHFDSAPFFGILQLLFKKGPILKSKASFFAWTLASEKLLLFHM